MDITRSMRFSQQLMAVPVLVALLLHPLVVVPEYVIFTIHAPVCHAKMKVEQKRHARKIKHINVAKPKMITPIRYTATQVKGYIREALHITHEPQSWSKPLYWIAYQESRFYARAVDGVAAKNVNLAGASQHAEGLMQVVPSTFRRHALRGMSNIWNPVDNVISSVRYIRGCYGNPYKIPGVFQTDQYNGY